MKNYFLYLFLIVCVSACKLNRFDKKGERHGKWEFYYDDAKAQVSSTGKFKHGLQIKLWKHYDNEGNLQKTENFDWKKKIITTRTYFPSGKMQSIGEATIVENPTELHYFWYGEWKYYSEEGKHIKSCFYYGGNLIGCEEKSK